MGGVRWDGVGRGGVGLGGVGRGGVDWVRVRCGWGRFGWCGVLCGRDGLVFVELLWSRSVCGFMGLVTLGLVCPV